MYNKSLKGALENSNGLQNTDEPVNIIKKKKKKKAGRERLQKFTSFYIYASLVLPSGVMLSWSPI